MIEAPSLPLEHVPVALTVDCVVFGSAPPAEPLHVLLIERAEAPFKGCWALPGGFVRADESLDVAAARELGEETGLAHVHLEQLYTFGEVRRDPRGRVVSTAYMALVRPDGYRLVASADAARAAWFKLDALPALAFDHAQIIALATTRLRAKIRYQPIGFALLPEVFSMPMLQRLYEQLLGQEVDRRNFQRKLLRSGVLDDTGELERDVPHRAAKLYTFNAQRYRELEAQGFEFALP
jgi:8-oxo-dGTP diphosphatase